MTFFLSLKEVNSTFRGDRSALHIFFAIASARLPETRTTPMPPTPFAVDIAAIVVLSLSMAFLFQCRRMYFSVDMPLLRHGE